MITLENTNTKVNDSFRKRELKRRLNEIETDYKSGFITKDERLNYILRAERIYNDNYGYNK